MDGIILLNKESGITSFSVINKLKHKLNFKKVGHAGTLDPLAEGLMIVLINNGTKMSDYLMKKDKEYYVEIELGYETDTLDSEGVTTEKIEEDKITEDFNKIEKVIKSFEKTYNQIPPKYSAIKINGKKLYELARQGKDVEINKREVQIKDIKDIKKLSDKNKYAFTCLVSSGTYIRSLVRDIGRELDCFANMTYLKRTKIDKFVVEDSHILDEIKEENDIITLDKVFDFLEITLSINDFNKLKDGIKLNIDLEDNIYKIYSEERFCGFGVVEDNKLKRHKYLI